MEKTLRGQNKGTAAKHRCRDLSRGVVACASTAYFRHGRVQKLVSLLLFKYPAQVSVGLAESGVSAIEAGPTEQVLVDQPTRTRSVPQKETPQLFLPSFLYDSPERDTQITPTAARA